MAKSGIDVSQWQGTINWSQVKGNVDFALIRAGYGDTLSYPKQVDWQYAANYAGCKANGIPVGVYFYSYATTTAQAEREADSCIALLKGKQFEYPVYYDVEEFDIFRSGNTNAIITAFCDKLEKAGYFVGLYICRSALQTYVSKQIRERYAIAVAEYGPSCNYDGPCGIWQNTSG
jgi:GH25 family lysozyme M1 (1,4-beta-N-acetylmuramidase)